MNDDMRDVFTGLDYISIMKEQAKMEEEKKPGVKKKVLVWGLLAVILGCVIGYLIYRTTPAYALSQLETGFREQDEQKIREYMDVEGTVGGFIDEYIEVYCAHYAEDLKNNPKYKNNKFMNPENEANMVKGFMKLSAGTIKDSAKQSLLSKKKDGRFNNFQPEDFTLSHIDRDGENATAHFILNRETGDPIPVQINMVQLDNNLWYVIGIANAKEIWEMCVDETGAIK